MTHIENDLKILERQKGDGWPRVAEGAFSIPNSGAKIIFNFKIDKDKDTILLKKSSKSQVKVTSASPALNS